MLAARITSVLVNCGEAYGTTRGRPGAIMRRLVHATHRWCFKKKFGESPTYCFQSHHKWSRYRLAPTSTPMTTYTADYAYLCVATCYFFFVGVFTRSLATTRIHACPLRSRRSTCTPLLSRSSAHLLVRFPSQLHPNHFLTGATSRRCVARGAT